MPQMIRSLALILGLGLAQNAAAQEAAAPVAEPASGEVSAAAGSGLSMGEPDTAATPDDIGATYIAETHGDWEMKCVRTADDTDPCQLYQLLKDAQGNAVAEISIFGLPAGQEAAAGATIVVPLETLLTAQLSLQIDSTNAKRYPFTWCSGIGCIARVGFTAVEVESFKRGTTASLTIVPVVAPDQKVMLSVSLLGFTAGLSAVNAANGV